MRKLRFGNSTPRHELNLLQVCQNETRSAMNSWDANMFAAMLAFLGLARGEDHNNQGQAHKTNQKTACCVTRITSPWSPTTTTYVFSDRPW